MTIKTILIPMGGQASDEMVLEAACVFARRFGSHLRALHIRPAAADTAPFMFDRLTSGLKQTVLQEVESHATEKAARVRQSFDQFCSRHDLPIMTEPAQSDTASASWHEDVGRVSEVLVRWGRLSDLIAFARPKASSAAIRRSPAGENLEAVLLETGRPVLVVPPNHQVQLISHIAIGWNASMEASRAVAMALPCLAAVDSVTILTSKKREESAQALVDYLAWHDITPSIRFFEPRHKAVSEVLLAEAKEIGAGLLLIGGFSHARARELLFGGVTRDLLANAELPIYMVH